MQVTAVVTRAELVELVHELTPLRVEISRDPRRRVLVERPRRVELAPRAGLRLGGSAKVHWEVAGLTIPVTLREWQVLLVPSVVVQRGAHVLAFDPVLEVLDFRRVPGFLDDRVVEAINEAFAVPHRKLAWNFTRTLSIRLALPARIAPGGRFELVPAGGSVVVTADELRVSATLAGHVRRGAGQEAAARPQAQRPS